MSDNNRTDGNRTHLPTMFEKDSGHGIIFTELDGELYLTLHCHNCQPDERPAFSELKKRKSRDGLKNKCGWASLTPDYNYRKT